MKIRMYYFFSRSVFLCACSYSSQQGVAKVSDSHLQFYKVFSRVDAKLLSISVARTHH